MASPVERGGKDVVPGRRKGCYCICLASAELLLLGLLPYHVPIEPPFYADFANPQL